MAPRECTHQNSQGLAALPVEVTGRRQNGARRQGFASPRQTTARPCPLCAVLTKRRGDGRLRRGRFTVRLHNVQKGKAGFPPFGGKPALLKQTLSQLVCRDRVTPYQETNLRPHFKSPGF